MQSSLRIMFWLKTHSSQSKNNSKETFLIAIFRHSEMNKYAIASLLYFLPTFLTYYSVIYIIDILSFLTFEPFTKLFSSALEACPSNPPSFPLCYLFYIIKSQNHQTEKVGEELLSKESRIPFRRGGRFLSILIG